MSTHPGFHGVPPIRQLPLQAMHYGCALLAIALCVRPFVLDLSLNNVWSDCIRGWREISTATHHGQLKGAVLCRPCVSWQ